MPQDGEVVIKSLAHRHAKEKCIFNGIIEDIGVLGYNGGISWKQTDEGLVINTLPIKTEKPVVLKISIK